MVALAGLTIALQNLTSGAGTLGTIFSSLGGMMAGIGSAITSAFGGAVDFVREKWQGFKDWWGENITPLWEATKEFAVNAFQSIVDMVTLIFGGAFDLLVALWEATVGVFQVLWDATMGPLVEGFQLLFTGAFQLLTGNFTGFVETLKESWDALVMPLVQPFVDLFQAGMALGSGSWEGFVGKLKDAWDNSVGPLVSAFLDPFLGALSSIGERWNTMVSNMRERFGFVDAIFVKLGEFKANFDLIRDNWGLIVNAMKTKFDAFIEPIKTALGVLLSPFQLAWDGIIAAIDLAKAGFDLFAGGLQTAYDSFIKPPLEFMNDTLESIVGLAGDAVDKVGGFFGGALDFGAGLIGLSEGGVTSGPSSGYPVMLHGTEAVVPLSGGRSIPVEMKGGGGSQTFNINVNPTGITDRTDKRDMARQIGNMIQQEVSRALGGTTMRGRM